MELPCFSPLAHFISNGHDLFTVLNDRSCQNFDHLIDSNVQIGGVTRKVIRVERFIHSPPWREGEKIVLMCANLNEPVKQGVNDG